MLYETKVTFDEIEAPSPNEFTAYRWSLPGKDQGNFSSLPDVAQTLRIPLRSFFANSLGDQRRVNMPVSAACGWGIEDMARIYYARAVAPDGTRFCLRFIFNAVEATANRNPENVQHYRRLITDARFHSDHLQATAGVITPIHYGVWAMDTKSWAGMVFFSLTQWCGVSWRSLYGTKMDTPENRLLVGRTFEMLHDIGIQLDGVVADSGDFRHVLFDVDDPGVSPDLIFKSGNHKCGRKIPIVPTGPIHACGCEELDSVLFLLGFSKPLEAPISADDAVKWYEEYARRHPSYSNSSILIAQRQRLYPNYPAVYSGLTIAFQDETEYPPLTLTDAARTQVDPVASMGSYSQLELAAKTLGRVYQYRKANSESSSRCPRDATRREVHVVRLNLIAGHDPPSCTVGSSLFRRFFPARWIDGPDVARTRDRWSIRPVARRRRRAIRVHKKSLFLNGAGHSKRNRVCLANAVDWGLEDVCDIYYARGIGDDGSLFCLRLLLNARVSLKPKGSLNHQHYMRLVRDAQFHAAHLQATAGIITPLHYGMWVMETDWAGTILFSLTSWAGIPYTNLIQTKLDTPAMQALVAGTFERLHDAGIQLDGRIAHQRAFSHVLIDIDLFPSKTKDKASASIRSMRCFIAGFADGSKHACKRQLPVLPLGTLVPTIPFGCQELSSVHDLLGFSRAERVDPKTFVAEARDWHRRYAETHPDYDNFAILIAQRMRLFPESQPLYTGVKVAFVDEDEELSGLRMSGLAEQVISPAEPMSTCTWAQLAARINAGQHPHSRKTGSASSH
uniref:Protein kinase domain-containing protein n=1 Tax=Mycena chlorophos TaxID=658473 RepID=A0ABQ0LME4_MYCCL|nr:predicted protein [Mycena chlorophos]